MSLRDSSRSYTQTRKVDYKKLYDFKVEENKLLAQEMISLRSELNQLDVISIS